MESQGVLVVWEVWVDKKPRIGAQIRNTGIANKRKFSKSQI
jgi:hypothetical protein